MYYYLPTAMKGGTEGKKNRGHYTIVLQFDHRKGKARGGASPATYQHRPECGDSIQGGKKRPLSISQKRRERGGWGGGGGGGVGGGGGGC